MYCAVAAPYCWQPHLFNLRQPQLLACLHLFVPLLLILRGLIVRVQQSAAAQPGSTKHSCRLQAAATCGSKVRVDPTPRQAARRSCVKWWCHRLGTTPKHAAECSALYRGGDSPGHQSYRVRHQSGHRRYRTGYQSGHWLHWAGPHPRHTMYGAGHQPGPHP